MTSSSFYCGRSGHPGFQRINDVPVAGGCVETSFFWLFFFLKNSSHLKIEEKDATCHSPDYLCEAPQYGCKPTN